MAGTTPRVVVVGSGPSSASAARLLVDRGVRVLMLEAGSSFPGGLVVRARGNVLYRRLPHRAIERHDVTVGDEPAEWWQSITPGGLSNHWTSAVPRFAPEDFTEGARLDPALRWPVRYEELAPYYAFCERLLTVTAGEPAFDQLPRGVAEYRRRLPDDWLHIAEAAGELGHGMTLMPMAVGRPWMIARKGAEFNSFRDVVGPLLQRPNFELRLGAQVTEVLPTDPARGGPGVRIRTAPDGSVEDLRGAAVVLGAGTLATTRLLMSSRSADAPDGIGNGRGVLGRYLHDHPKTWWPCTLSEPLTLPPHLHYMTRGPYGSSAPLTGTSWTIGLRRPRDRPRTYVGMRGNGLGVQVFGTMRPSPDTRVHLSDERDEHGVPLVGVDLSFDDAGREATLRAHETLTEVFARAGIELDVTDRPELTGVGSAVHYGGSARMHDDPDLGVLDRWNRVHEMPEIVVGDMSCFTTGPEKNPTLTAMALASRAADHLADELVG